MLHAVPADLTVCTRTWDPLGVLFGLITTHRCQGPNKYPDSLKTSGGAVSGDCPYSATETSVPIPFYENLRGLYQPSQTTHDRLEFLGFSAGMAGTLQQH